MKEYVKTIPNDVFHLAFGCGGVDVPVDSNGSLTDRRAVCALAAIARAQTVLEIGVGDGTTARMLRRVIGITNYIGLDTEIHEDVSDMISGCHDWFRLVVRNGIKTPDDYPPPVDFCYVDAWKSVEALEADWKLAHQAVQLGVIAWHDYSWPTVWEHLNKKARSGHHILRVGDSVVCFEVIGQKLK